MPGLTSTQGTFAVTLRNDLNTNAGDQQLVGTAVTRDSSPTADSNGILILTSTGTYSGASRTITAVVQRGNLNIRAALSLPGVQSRHVHRRPAVRRLLFDRRPRLELERYLDAHYG
jgi:hypothetical protein